MNANTRNPRAAELADRKVSRYQSARDNRGKPIALVEILEAIQAGHWEKPVAAIREALAAGDTAKADLLKKRLPAFTAAGVFSKRCKTGLDTPSGCLIVDVDKLDSMEIAEALRDALGADPHVLAAFVSPSGRGVKAVVYVGTCADDKEAKSIFRALAEYLATTYSIQTDPSGKDVCRPCFVSHDPGAIIRTGEVRPFTARAEAPKPAAPAAPKVRESRTSTRTAPAPTVEARLDRICKRQQARFLDHLRDTRQSTPQLEADVTRVFGFIFADVKTCIREHYTETHNDRIQRH